MNEELITDDHTLCRVEFRGFAGEWFGIWIVNLLLTLVTFGIYSAWAKVRTQKYFYQNTYMGGRNFDYHATGLQIFMGRVILVFAIAALQIILTIAPIAILVVFPAMLFLVPYFIVSALRFRARNSSWANVKFSFSGGYWGMFLLQVVYPILVTLTLFITAPFWVRAFRRYFVNGHKIGTTSIQFDAPIWQFYRAFLVVVAWTFVVGFLYGFLSSMTGSELRFPSPDQFNLDQPTLEDAFRMLISLAPLYFMLLVIYVAAVLVYEAMIRNVVYNHTIVQDRHLLHSYVSPPRYLWIVVSNAIVSIMTLGLLLPWAKVRLHRYLCSCTGLTTLGEVDLYAAGKAGDRSSVGEAFVDIEGIDIGFGV